MKIQYLDQVQDLTLFDNEQRLAEINRIFASLFDANEIVQEVFIDGLSFREAYEPYIYQNIGVICEIELKTVRGDILVDDILREIQTYLPKLNRAIESISDLFYGEMTTEGWGYFSQLVEGMQWMVQSIQVVRNQLERTIGQVSILPGLIKVEDEFNSLLLELGGAVERKEYVAAGDLLKYELGDLFQQFEEILAVRVIQ